MSQKAEKGVSKELRIVTRPVVSVSDVVKDDKKVGVLQVIGGLGEVSERGLINALYILKTEKGRDLGYQFQVVGRAVNSRELLEDLRILLYLGLVEVTERRKLRLTSQGRELLEKLGPAGSGDLLKLVDEIKQRVLSEDSLMSMISPSRTRGRRRR